MDTQDIRRGHHSQSEVRGGRRVRPVSGKPRHGAAGRVLRRAEAHRDDPAPGMHRYMPNAGYPETRGAVAAQLSEETGLSFGADNVIMSCGAGGALNVVLKTLLDPGDEVVIFAPYFVEYFFYADNHGGSCKVVPPDDGLPARHGRFRVHDRAADQDRAGELARTIRRACCTPRMCWPSLAEVIRRKEEEFDREIFLVSDEPYRRLLYDGLEYPHIFHHHSRSIVATSHSKDLALPGERIGYVAVHPDYEDAVEVMDGLIFCNRTLGFVNAPALMQHIVAKLQSVTVDIAQYQAKRDFMYDALTGLGYDLVLKPQGAFYMFPKAPIDDDVAVRGGAPEAQRPDCSGNGIRDARVLQDLVLRHRPDP